MNLGTKPGCSGAKERRTSSECCTSSLWWETPSGFSRRTRSVKNHMEYGMCDTTVGGSWLHSCCFCVWCPEGGQRGLQPGPEIREADGRPRELTLLQAHCLAQPSEGLQPAAPCSPVSQVSAPVPRPEIARRPPDWPFKGGRTTVLRHFRLPRRARSAVRANPGSLQGREFWEV